MKRNFSIFCIPIAALFWLGSCKKNGGDSTYMKATINGVAWKAGSVNVTTVPGPGGTEPAIITGYLNNEIISVRLTNLAPGAYPFKESRINPVVLVSFTVEYFESSQLVKWSTGTEMNVSGFNLEASPDGINWSLVSSTGPTGSGSNYQVVIDNNFPLNSNSYYRLKVIDTNGSFAYSQVRVISGSYPAYYTPPGGLERRGYDGVLEIISADLNSQTVSGRFSFKAKTAAGQVYTIASGEFRASY